MISLLPVESRRNIRAGRLNNILIRYVWLFAIVGVLVLASFGTGILLIVSEKNRSEADYQKITQENISLESVRKAATEFAANLKLAKTIIGDSRSTTDYVAQFTAAISSGVVLNSLTIDNTQKATNVATPIVLSIQAKTVADVLRLKTSMQNSPLFDKVNIGQYSTPPVATSTYSVSASVNAVIEPITATSTTQKATP